MKQPSKRYRVSGSDAWIQMVMVSCLDMNYRCSGRNRRLGQRKRTVLNRKEFISHGFFRQRFYGIAEEDQIRFDDILRQMYVTLLEGCRGEDWTKESIRNDLIQPRVPGQFRLSDLKRNGYLAERFFDTFMSFDRFQIHESYQGCIRAKREQALEKRRQLIEESVVPSEEEAMMMDNSLGLFLLR